MTSIEFNTHLTLMQSPLLGFALTLTRDGEDAQDLCQDTFLKAIKYKDKYQDNTNFKAWLFTIMRNTFYNKHKRQKLTNDVFAPTEEMGNLKNVSSNSPETYYNFKEIDKEINKLNDLYSVPFRMHMEGFKYEEIGEELNIPVGTVKSRVFFARKKLSKSLAEYKS